MRSENDTPVEQRYLIIFGKASSATIELVKDGFSQRFNDKTVIVFVDYSNADFPIGKVFTKAFFRDDAANFVNMECKVIAVTQEFAKPFDEIPHGWKTICAFEFEPCIPSLFQTLPEIDSWYDDRCVRVCISGDETWLALSNNEN